MNNQRVIFIIVIFSITSFFTKISIADEVLYTPSTIPTPVTLLNDTFENGVINYTTRNLNPKIALTTELVHSDSYALKATIVQDWDCLIRKVSGFELGKTYQLTAWLALDIASASTQKGGINVYADANGSKKVALSDEYFTASNTYTKHELTFIATQSDYYLFIKTRTANTTRKLYVDDLKIEKIYGFALISATSNLNGKDMDVTIYSPYKIINSAVLVGATYENDKIKSVNIQALKDIPKNIDFVVTVPNCSATKWFLVDNLSNMTPLATVRKPYLFDE